MARKLIIFTLLYSSLIGIGCKVKLPPVSSVKQVTFKLDNFLSGCTKRQNGQGGLIDFKVNLIVWVSNGATGKSKLDEFNFSSDINSALKLPVNINANMPTDGNFAEIEINVTGVNCSTCANGRSVLLTDGTECNAVLSGNNIIAALPRWRGGRTNVNTSDIIEITSASNYTQIPNVPSSCGCLVNP
jgi:hypothetical protein